MYVNSVNWVGPFFKYKKLESAPHWIVFPLKFHSCTLKLSLSLGDKVECLLPALDASSIPALEQIFGHVCCAGLDCCSISMWTCSQLLWKLKSSMGRINTCNHFHDSILLLVGSQRANIFWIQDVSGCNFWFAFETTTEMSFEMFELNTAVSRV